MSLVWQGEPSLICPNPRRVEEVNLPPVRESDRRCRVCRQVRSADSFDISESTTRDGKVCLDGSPIRLTRCRECAEKAEKKEPARASTT